MEKTVEHAGRRVVGYMRHREEKKEHANLFFEDRLYWCLSTIGERKYQVYQQPGVAVPTYREEMLFTMLEDHIAKCRREGNRAELARLDEILYKDVSELSAMNQILSMIQSHRPRHIQLLPSFLPGCGLFRATQHIKTEYYEKRSPVSNSDPCDPDYSGPLARDSAGKRLAALLKGFRTGPLSSDKRISQAWLDFDESQRDILSNFWAQFRDQEVKNMIRQGLEDEVKPIISLLSISECPSYMEAVEEERQWILSVINHRKAEQEEKKFSQLKSGSENSQTEWGTTSLETKVKIPSRKPKTKTRAKQQESESESELPNYLQEMSIGNQAREYYMEPESTDDEERVTTVVRKSTFTVFKAMFPRPQTEDDSQKSFRWDVFCLAMADPNVGVVAHNNGGGSAVQFEPSKNSKWAGKGKIVFHRPHPDDFIDPVMLRSMGKRLNKWFGWNEDTFILEEKAEKNAKGGVDLSGNTKE